MSHNRVIIITDSAGDMLPEDAGRLGVLLLPLSVTFGDETFEDGVTLSRDALYTRLSAADVLPKTSLIGPARYEQAFRAAIDAGCDVVCLTLSSRISGSYQSAMLAASELGDRVHVVDTLQFCGPEYLLTLRAVRLRDEGRSAAEIALSIHAERLRPRVIGLLDTLRYLKLGGRISSAAAAIGGLLAVKPVITIEDGEVKLLGKARGSRNGNNLLMRFVKEHGGIDWEKPILLSWAGLSRELLDRYIADSAALYEGRSASELPIARVGASIGTHTGPGAIAFSFYPREELIK